VLGFARGHDGGGATLFSTCSRYKYKIGVKSSASILSKELLVLKEVNAVAAKFQTNRFISSFPSRGERLGANHPRALQLERAQRPCHIDTIPLRSRPWRGGSTMSPTTRPFGLLAATSHPRYL
jgi:hypothetical protein